MSVVREVPIAQLATSLAVLRGPRTDATSALAPLPLRVAANDDGTYEVLDGFKRLAHWTRDGHTHVSVVVEDAAGIVRKARLLEANAPRRTVSAMDEARVVHSLADEDRLTPPQIAKLLGHGRGWVDRRLTLGRRLAPGVSTHVDAGRLSATTAHHLAVFPRAEQPRLADALLRHGLRTREGDAFLEAWRVADDAATREALLRDPRRAVPAPQDPAVSPLGPMARELQARFDQTERALAELLPLDFTGFADPDRRVLEACQRRLAAQVVQLARTVQEETAHADPRGTDRTPAAPARAHSDPRHRAPARPGRQDDPSSARPTVATDAAREARSLSGAGQGTLRGGTALAPDLARTAGAGLHGRPDDPQDLSADAGTAASDAPDVPPVRDGAGDRGAVGLESLPRDDRRPQTIVHAFAMVLAYSRRNFIAVFRDERLPTLLWAHGEAFRYHGGVCCRIAYDNQTAITLGRVSGRPRWHPSFLAFAQHYGFEPSVGRPRHKERRGKVERPFLYFEEDFLRARTFASWDDLRGQVREWLDTVANVRVHGTTRRRVDETYAEERPCLIALPTVAYPAARRETRSVQKDGLIPVDGSYYPVPDQSDGATVSVHIDPVRVQIFDAAGGLVATHAVPDQPTRLPSPLAPSRPHDPALSRSAHEARFLARFPDAGAFLDGLKSRMTTLAPIHLHTLARLADLYGDAAMRDALAVATAYRNFNARAIERILARAHPTVVPEPAVGSATRRPDALGALDDVEPGSPQDYTLDSMPPTGGTPDGA